MRSILGPLLFNIYINDLPLYIENPLITCDLFADDGTLNYSDKDIKVIQDSLQNAINNVQKWTEDNHMQLHPSKTKSMLNNNQTKTQNKPFKFYP